MALFHLSLAVVTLTAGNASLGVSVYKTMLDFQRRDEVASGAVGWDLFPEYRDAGEMPFCVLTACFFVLSFAFHAGNAFAWEAFYIDELTACRTPTRWLEYGMSAPLLMLLIAYTLGIRDRAVLFSVAALVATTMPYGYWTEVTARPSGADAWTAPLRSRLLPWALGHIPQVAAWTLVLVQYYDGALEPHERPWWVDFILWGELLLFFSFGTASALSQLAAPRHFYRGELLFQVLSLVSKGTFGVLLLANVLMYESFDDVFQPGES